MGIDASSTISGIALIETPSDVRAVAHWQRDKSRSHPQGFEDYYKWLGRWIWSWKPQMAVVEMLSVERNAQTAKTIAFYQAVSVLCCKLNGLVVVESGVRTARKVVLGNGGLSKDDSWDLMRKRYPNLFSPKAQGGTDEMDALTHALAGTTVAER